MPRARLLALVGRALALSSFAIALVALPPSGAAATPDSRVKDTFHLDHRSSPKLQLELVWDAPAGLDAAALAREFLVRHAADYGLPADLAGLRLEKVQESLLGWHHVFRQQIGGIDVDTATITVSIAKADGRVYRVYNNVFPVKDEAGLAGPAALDMEAAYDAAWQRLRPHGPLKGAPRARLAWTPEGESFRLNWIVDLELEAPYGGWQLRVDAVSGRVVETRDAHIYRLVDELTTAPLSERIDSYAGPVLDRRAEFARYETQARAFAPAGVAATGTGVVFDPDPRTTLVNDNLQDGSAASAFTAAYFTRSLPDITFSGGVYRLTGPWVTIIDFESPSTAPSTTTTGDWTAVRGNNAFNDALCYFQLDQNQRYIQSLGFTGGTGIQEGSIGTDSDGLSGADNSHYIPSSNRMAFGHGCVDDSEDTDVVLHEYGHAITHSADPSWGGGDSGAIGEGFGDYWAGSYSYSTLNGDTYHPEWVFSWDGHGNGNQCWAGRIMNASGAQYVHTTTYGAHQSIPGGYQSDELWSTPIFQALVALDGLGYPREDADQIVLEAMFGMGSGFKMRDMASSIIQAAGLLHPGGPHADTYIQKFLVHNIVDIPVVSLAALDVPLISAGGNGAADPGETVTFSVDVKNEGTLGATAVSAVLTAITSGVIVNQGASAYPDLPPGANALGTTPYSITIPSGLACGDPVQLSLLVSFDDGSPNQTTLGPVMGTGVPQGASVSVSPALPIPDNNPAGVQSSLFVPGSGATVTGNLNVDIHITHTYIGDLIVTLQAPGGTQVVLHNRSGGSADDLVGNYPNTLTPANSLAAMIGGPLNGTWKLIVSDNAGIDVGVLDSWGINDVSGYDCDGGATAVASVAGVPARFALSAARPNPFGAGGVATIAYAVPGAGAEVALAVFDVSGRRVKTLQQGFVPAGRHTAIWSGDDASGAKVGSGVYFYRLESADFVQTRKLTVLK